MQRKVEEGEAVEGPSVGVRAVLDLLHKRGPMTVPRMGRAQAVSRQSVQRTVSDAVARGLAGSVPNPAHQRSPLIRPTAGGRAAITAVVAREHTVLREVKGGLPDADVRACVRVLGEMLRLFDRVAVG
ncbi:MarR family transcriptional regulator [Streptomyces cinereospinus]